MTNGHPGYRIFILGAGFSRLAGLPLADELFTAVRLRIETLYGVDTKFHRDLKAYRNYCEECGVEYENDGALDLEKFMSYLDIEHYLGLRGSDTWSSEGNESQLMIRKAIGAVIHQRTPQASNLAGAYYKFADSLSPNDIVITFNYDLVLERALEYVGKKYRRFPYRYKSVSDTGGVLESGGEEVVLLKLHGSIDWFDDRNFLSLKASLQGKGAEGVAIHDVLDDPARYRAGPLVNGLLPKDDMLRHLQVIEDLDAYYRSSRDLSAPFLLSPSHVKFVYAQPLLGFWHGIGRSGGYNLGVSVIGFSLPQHDEYIRIALYQLLSNYGSWWNEPMLGVFKDFARFVDFKNNEDEANEYRAHFRFSDSERSRFFLEGFGDAAIDFLFNQSRTEPSK